MARHLEPWRRTKIVHMIRSGRFTSSQIAESAECDRRTVSTIRKNLRLFGTPGTPSVHIGYQPTVTPYMIDVLLDHLNEQPGLYLEEMVGYLYYQSRAWVSKYSVQRALTRWGWTKKQMRRKAQEQNPRLRAFYQHKLSKFHSYQLVFVDENVINKWDIGGLAGPRLELPRSNYQNFRGASAIIYYQHMPKTALFCLVSIVAQLMLPFSKISWNNFFGIVGGSQR
jgi:transposase